MLPKCSWFSWETNSFKCVLGLPQVLLPVYPKTPHLGGTHKASYLEVTLTWWDDDQSLHLYFFATEKYQYVMSLWFNTLSRSTSIFNFCYIFTLCCLLLLASPHHDAFDWHTSTAVHTLLRVIHRVVFDFLVGQFWLDGIDRTINHHHLHVHSTHFFLLNISSFSLLKPPVINLKFSDVRLSLPLTLSALWRTSELSSWLLTVWIGSPNLDKWLTNMKLPVYMCHVILGFCATLHVVKENLVYYYGTQCVLWDPAGLCETLHSSSFSTHKRAS